jgi:hypothetical protein
LEQHWKIFSRLAAVQLSDGEGFGDRKETGKKAKGDLPFFA